MQRIVLLSIIIIISINEYAQQLRIGLFNELNTKSVVFSVVNCSYLMVCDNRAIQTFRQGQNLFITKEGDSLRCIGLNIDFGLFLKIKLNAMADSAVFSLRPVDPKANIRYYDDNLELVINLGKMQTINIVDIDKYLAGVVESEGGLKAFPEYYKTQTILCRTYTLNHLDKHIEEDFNLCDGTHCQAYNGHNSGNTDILKAAFETRGLVITDDDTTLITAAFHSNCGGETENASKVWLINKSYLKAIQDPYCQNQKNFHWENKIPFEQWKKYLIDNGFHIKAGISQSFFNFTQYSRRQYYRLGKDSISFKKIRDDFGYHSAFFSIEVKNDNVEIHGRGYGHGVGLCQEGAMQMAKLGYNFREIIQFYYQVVNITDVKNVPFNKNPSLKFIIK